METAAVNVSRRRTFARVGIVAILIGFGFVAGRLSANRGVDLQQAQEQAKPADLARPQAVPKTVEPQADLTVSVDENVEDKESSEPYVRCYKVADLVTPTPNLAGTVASADFDSLIELITVTIEHDSWTEHGAGPNEIQPFSSNLSLVVSATDRVHDQLADLLQMLRIQQYNLSEDILDRVREASARKLYAAIPLKVFDTQISDVVQLEILQGHLSNHFESAVSQLTEEYGAPDQVCEAGNADFPDWATAQRIAVWNRPGGKLYFALQDAQPAGLALVTGWWEDSFGPLKPMRIAQESFVGAR